MLFLNTWDWNWIFILYALTNLIVGVWSIGRAPFVPVKQYLVLNIGFDVSKLWRLLEDFVVACVCGFWVVWICNPLIDLIQGCLILIFLKHMCFQREVENQPVELSFQPVVLHSEVFEKAWRWLNFLSNQFNRLFWKFNRLIFEFLNKILLS